MNVASYERARYWVVTWKLPTERKWRRRRVYPSEKDRERAKRFKTFLEAAGFEAIYYPAGFHSSSNPQELEEALYYPVPTMPIEVKPPPIYELGVMIGVIIGEGSFYARVVREDMVSDYLLPREKRIYKMNWLIPYFALALKEKDKEIVFKIAKAFDIPVDIYKKVYYRARATKAVKTMAIAKWIKPLLPPETTRAQQVNALLKIFKEKPSISITPEQASTIMSTRGEERLKLLLEWKQKKLI